MDNRESSQDSNKVERAIEKVSQSVGIIKSEDEGHHGKYANYLTMRKALSQPLAENNLTTSHAATTIHREIAGSLVSFPRLVTRVKHKKTGQWVEQTLDGPPTHGGIQTLASDTTMAKRQNLTLIFDLVYSDDETDKDGAAPGDPLADFDANKELGYLQVISELNNAKSTDALGKIWESKNYQEKLKALDKLSQAKAVRVATEIQVIKDKEVENAPRKKAKSAPRKSS